MLLVLFVDGFFTPLDNEKIKKRDYPKKEKKIFYRNNVSLLVADIVLVSTELLRAIALRPSMVDAVSNNYL